MTANRRYIIAAIASALLLTSIANARNKSWAQPLTVSGVPNLNIVDKNLYRSAQPSSEGFLAIEQKLYIRTVIDLRELHSDTALLVGTKINQLNVPMNPLYITTEEVIAALRFIKLNQSKGPVLVHCQHGADRTGVIMAMYRIVYQGWSKADAIDEMKNGGYEFHSYFVNIPAFVNNADIAAIKAALAKV